MQRSEVEKILGRKTIIELTPIKIKKADKSDKICYFFDTDDNASPFDINMAYDAGFDVVVPFNNVTKDNVTKLVQDAIFSRKPKRITSTNYFFIVITPFSNRTISPVFIFEISISSTQGISEIIAPTATTVSHSLFMIPAGATPPFFNL